MPPPKPRDRLQFQRSWQLAQAKRAYRECLKRFGATPEAQAKPGGQALKLPPSSRELIVGFVEGFIQDDLGIPWHALIVASQLIA